MDESEVKVRVSEDVAEKWAKDSPVEAAEWVSKMPEGEAIKDHLTNTGSKKATMIEQYGWMPIVGKGWKVTPTKTFNRNWSKSIDIDDKLSLDFIHSFKDTKPVYYPSIKAIEHIPLINQLLKRTDINPRSASVVVVKENSNIIYANILSNTDPKNQKCENQKGHKILSKTAKFIKDLL